MVSLHGAALLDGMESHTKAVVDLDGVGFALVRTWSCYSKFIQ